MEKEKKNKETWLLMTVSIVRSSPLVTRDSVAPKPCSSHPSWVWNRAVSTRPSTTRSWSATLISVRTCTPTPSSPVEPPCTPVLPIVCRRKSPPWPHPPLRSRSSLPLSVNTPSGSVDPSWPLCPPSNRCGSPSRNTMNPALALSTANASKLSRRRFRVKSLVLLLITFPFLSPLFLCFNFDFHFPSYLFTLNLTSQKGLMIVFSFLPSFEFS